MKEETTGNEQVVEMGAVTFSKQKNEALERLNIIGVMDDVIKNLKDDQIMYSERQNDVFCAVLYNVEEGTKLHQHIQKFEAEYDAYVYHVQLLHTHYGEMYSLLYVSKHSHEWEMDRDDLKQNETYAYVITDTGSEIGLIGIEPKIGGILRTY